MIMGFGENLRRILRNGTPPPAPGSLFRSTAVFLLLFEQAGEPHLLAIQKTDTEGYPWRNQVALPGGHVDGGESPVEAAFRELEEELRIPPDQVELAGSLGHFQTINLKDIEVFVGAWDGQGPVRPDPAEIRRVLTLPLAELLAIHERSGFHGRVPDISELIYPIAEARIWGVTARILHHFMETIYPPAHRHRILGARYGGESVGRSLR